VTDPTPPGVPATPVSADVPADEPVAPAPVPEVPVPPTAPEVPAFPVTPVEPATPATPVEPVTPAVPVTPPAPAVPEVPATPMAPTAPEPPAAPPAPEPPPAPAPAPTPAPVPAPEPPAAPEPPTATLSAGLAAAAETTTETAPHPAVPSTTLDPYAAADEDPVRKARLRGLLLGLAAAVLLMALIGGLVLRPPLTEASSERRVNDRRADALSQASQLALNLVSLNYQTLDEDLKRISDSTTGKAREEFNERILENESYKTLVKDNQAVITSKIQRIGLEQCGTDDAACQRGDTATVLVFLDQESKNKLRPTPRIDRNRVVLTLVRNGDKWLVSEVKVL
jgi:hypothetical protein